MARVGEPLRWSELYAARRAAAGRWPSVFGLRVEKTPGRVVASVCSPGARVLDVGAGTGALREALARHAPGARYVGLDPDPGTPHDLRALTQVTEPVDVAAVLEVIEHLTLDDGLALLRAVRAQLVPGGACVVSTPAIQTPGRFLRDATHQTPYAHDELAGVCTLAGFTVERLVRTWNAPALARAFRLWIAAPVHRYLGVDFAHSVCAVARRPA